MTCSRRPPLARLALLATLTILVVVTTRATPQAALADEGDPQIWGRIVLADFEAAGLSREEVAAAFDAALGSQDLMDAMAQADADITMAQPSPETLCELTGKAITSVDFVETCLSNLLSNGISWRYNPNGCRGTLDNPHKSKHVAGTFGSTARTSCSTTPQGLTITNRLYWNPKFGARGSGGSWRMEAYLRASKYRSTQHDVNLYLDCWDYSNKLPGSWKAFSHHSMIGSDGDYYYAYLSRTEYGFDC